MWDAVLDRDMTIVVETPGIAGLGRAVDALREWQYDEAPMQLHPGDLGWFWRFGAAATAAAVRVWTRSGRILAVGLLDGEALLRLTMAPDARDDDELARQLAADLSRPERGVLGAATVYVEAPVDARLHDLLSAQGWSTDEPRTPLCRDLRDPVAPPDVRIEVVGPELVATRVAVQRAAFDRSTFTDERWHAMAGGPPYSEARCLVAYDQGGAPVAAVTVWSAGVGRPGLIEPMGVHREHRGRGHGRAITVAAAAALQEMGASSAVVCTASANVGAVATYRAAGFTAAPEVHDRRRPRPVRCGS